MEILTILKKCLNIENIDRKRVQFTKHSKYLDDQQVNHVLPELIIIKNEDGKLLLNTIVRHLNDVGSAKEKGMDYMGDNADFPYFIVSTDMITCGVRMGCWEHYGNDLSSLSKEILLDEQQDDYVNFKCEIERLFGIV